MTKLCTETFGLEIQPHETYIECGGYKAWKNIVSNHTSKSEIINKIKNSDYIRYGFYHLMVFHLYISGQKYLVYNQMRVRRI